LKQKKEWPIKRNFVVRSTLAIIVKCFAGKRGTYKGADDTEKKMI